MYYVYIRFRPDGRPFYVGKGKARRVNLRHRNNQHYMNIIRKYGWENIITETIAFETEEEAYAAEKEMIAYLSQWHKLCNRNEGGKGGLSPCDETRALLREAKKLVFETTDLAERISNKQREKWADPEYAEKQSNRIKQGRINNNCGARHSHVMKELYEKEPERREVISKRVKQWMSESPENLAKCTAWRKDEEKSKQADIKTGKASAERWKDPEFREKWVSSKGLSTKSLSDREVQEIRYLAKCGLGKRDIYPLYDISCSRCQYIMSGQTKLYQNIPDL